VRYSKYPSYRDSGVEWLGEVPEHWVVGKIKNSAIIFNGATPKSATKEYWDGNISWIGPADMGKSNSRDIFSGARNITSNGYNSCGTTLVPEGSVVLSSRAPIGKVAIAGKKLCTNQGCKSLVVNQHFSNIFIFYILISNTKQLNLLGRGTTFLELSAEELSSFNIPILPLQEQQTIANYLDTATEKIDTLIEKQTKLIALLKEKRQAVISTAVTRGLDNTVAMKDSGVEWLGEIPEHWSVSPLKFLLVEPLLYGANESADRNNPNDPRYIRITDIKKDGTLHNNTFRSLPMEIAQPYLLKNHSLLLARSGATVGKTFLYDESWGLACFAGYLIKATILSHKANAKFVSLFTKTTNYWQWLKSSQIKATIENVSAEKYANLNIPMPPRAEQNGIVSYIENKTTKIDNLITKSTKSIDLLKEKRTALISSAVTGKIDVRNL
jgi:type I restriction enzyme, S subunit